MILTQLRARQPETVVLAAFAPPVGMFLRQARELNFRSQFICPLACQNPDLFTLGQEAEEGLFVTTPAATRDSPLSDRYRDKFHDDPNFISWGFYDAILMLAELAPRCAGTPAPGECLRENLRRSEGFATSRGQLAFDDRGELPLGLALYQSVSGKLVPASVP